MAAVNSKMSFYGTTFPVSQTPSSYPIGYADIAISGNLKITLFFGKNGLALTKMG
jgi:hypothetical protein